MGSLFAALVDLALSASSVAETAQQRANEPPEVVFGCADSEVALKTELFRRIFGSEHFDWNADLDAGTITFTSATKIVRAPVQVIGTYNTLDHTFLWGWDHPSVSDPLAADARIAYQFGKIHEFPLFTERKVECTEEQAWGFTAVALYLAGAQGAYRGPAGTTLVFMTFGEITIERAQ